MLIACHLFFGTLLGIILAEHWNRRSLLSICMVGILLPDLIDKPFGILIIPGVHDGRMICHSVIGIILIIALVWYLFRDHLIVLALGAGVILHQILDTMWEIPVNWFFPLFGPFPVHDNYQYFETGLLRELTTPSEWVFLTGTLILLYRVQREQNDSKLLIGAIGAGITAVILLTFSM